MRVMEVISNAICQLCVLALTAGLIYSVLAMISCQERSDIRAYDINKRRIESMHALGNQAIVAFAPARK